MLSTENFSYDSQSRTFAAEASSLLVNGPSFSLRSAKTGKVASVMFVKCHTDTEGDITFWEYRSEEAADFSPFSVHIFND